MPDTASEYKQHLSQLQEVILSALLFYTVWNKLRLHGADEVPWDLDRQNHILARWGGFFSPVGIALQRAALVELAKVLDRDTRTVSLPNLLNQAQRDSSLIPNARPGDVKAIAETLKRARATAKTVMKLRNQRLTHADARPEALPPLMNREIESLIDDVKSAFNRLSLAHDGSFYSWDFVLQESQQDTTGIIQLLVEETERAEKDRTYKIVEIISGHIKEMETVLGHTLGDDELDGVLSQFSATPKQAELVRQGHGAKRPAPEELGG